MPTPTPLFNVPKKVTYTQMSAAVTETKNGAPEADEFTSPFKRNEVRIGQEVVQNIGVQNWFMLKFFAEFVAMDNPTSPLSIREIELNLIRTPDQRSSFSMLFDGPTAVRDEGVGTAVDNSRRLLSHGRVPGLRSIQEKIAQIIWLEDTRGGVPHTSPVTKEGLWVLGVKSLNLWRELSYIPEILGLVVTTTFQEVFSWWSKVASDGPMS
jgi:hypothetical protein